MNWKVLQSQVPQNLEQLQSLLLANRSVADMASFLSPMSPLALTPERVGIDPVQLAKAVGRLQQAKDAQESVVVFGDYDADGICSTAVLWLTLHHLGIKAVPFIPHREKHGYGMSAKSLKDLLSENQPSLIVTVDNGIVAQASVAELNKQGIEVIITDHHSPESELPAAHAIVHTTQLCGTTVAWMLAQALDSEFAEGLLDLCGIATIADQVQLVNANRSFAKFGLQALQKTQRPGLKLLMEAVDLKPSQVSTSTVNFVIAPRLNALGRLEHGLNALRLICTTNRSRARLLVETVSVANQKRQDLTTDSYFVAQRQAEQQEAEHVLIASDSEFHEGIIGLTAGRLMEKYDKPAIVISIGHDTAKGSARSIPGVNITELLRQVKADLLDVGGHPMAAGFSLLPEKVPEVTQKLQALAKAQIKAELLVPTLAIECCVPFEMVTRELVESLEALAPYGQGNPDPVLGLRGVRVLDASTVGKDHQHLKLAIGYQDPELNKQFQVLEAMGWNLGEWASELKGGAVIDIAGTISLNTWKNRVSLQMRIQDLKSPAEPC